MFLLSSSQKFLSVRISFSNGIPPTYCANNCNQAIYFLHLLVDSFSPYFHWLLSSGFLWGDDNSHFLPWLPTQAIPYAQLSCQGLGSLLCFTCILPPLEFGDSFQGYDYIWTAADFGFNSYLELFINQVVLWIFFYHERRWVVVFKTNIAIGCLLFKHL